MPLVARARALLPPWLVSFVLIGLIVCHGVMPRYDMLSCSCDARGDDGLFTAAAAYDQSTNSNSASHVVKGGYGYNLAM